MNHPSLLLLTALLVAVVSLATHAADKESEEGFVSLTDGKSFDGWKRVENKDSWTLEDGAFKANGPRSHLFYVGDDKPFKNFELKVDVMTRANSNGGIYFHTKFQPEGWPSAGYESQVNNTHRDPQKTGGLYNTAKVLEAPAKDDEWFTQHIIVEGKHVVVKIDGKTVVDFTEPDDREGPVKLSEGTFALQAHDPGSTVYFKNIRAKRLP
ncbi:MAG: DUF1080 domain-containing protein [Pirellulaceae bacterium]